MTMLERRAYRANSNGSNRQYYVERAWNAGSSIALREFEECLRTF